MRPVTILFISIMNVINWKLSVKVLWRLSIFPPACICSDIDTPHCCWWLGQCLYRVGLTGSMIIRTELIKLVKMKYAWMLDNNMYCHERTWIQYISITDPKESIHDLCTGWIDDLWNMRPLNFYICTGMLQYETIEF